MAFRGYKFRIYPTPEQEVVLRKTIGCCRYVYNHALALRRESWVNSKENIGYSKTSKSLTKLKGESDTAWLQDVSSVALQQSLRNLDVAFVNFFKKKSNYPKFKKKTSGGSARFLTNAFRFKENGLSLAKVDSIIKIVLSRNLPSSPSQCTVSQNASGQWFASFLCEVENVPLPKSSKEVGIDLGIDTFATLNDGRKFKLPPSIKKSRKRIDRLQRQYSRKKLGSKNREKARIKVAREYQRVTNIRKDFLHKLSTSIVRENQTIAIEDLAVSNMTKDRRLARSIGEQGWREFRTMLDYKCGWYGRELVVVDRYFPSSKTCSCCGRESKFGLNIRNWTCSCGAVHDRDVNAAKNILAAGHVVSACGADRSLEEQSLSIPRRNRKIKA